MAAKKNPIISPAGNWKAVIHPVAQIYTTELVQKYMLEVHLYRFSIFILSLFFRPG
jgi:hypothetical protein